MELDIRNLLKIYDVVLTLSSNIQCANWWHEHEEELAGFCVELSSF